jgi:hypothetical protein
MEKLPQQSEDLGKEVLMVKAALKSGQAEEKGFRGEYFIDHEYLLEDDEIMVMVANQWPYTLGHLDKKNRDKDFVIKWLMSVNNKDNVEDIYRDAQKNALRIILSPEEMERIKKR